MGDISFQRVGEAMYERDHCAQALGIRLMTIGSGHAEMTMEVRRDMANGHAICHGGIIFTLADTAFAYACNADNHITVASGASIQFLEPGKLGEVLTATSRRAHERGRSGVYDIEVRGGDGRLIALFRGLSRRLDGHVVQTEEEKHG